MADRPAFLGQTYSSVFQDVSVARAYRHRPPYSPPTFEHLLTLMAGSPRRVLDLGCGTGNVCRGLAPLVDEVDAVDASEAMIEEGRRLDGGQRPNIRWIVSPAETAPLRPPYAMVTAGASLHWMDWDALLPSLARSLNPGGYLVIMDNDSRDVPWRAELASLIPRYSINKDFRSFDLVQELQKRGRFELAGNIVTPPVPFEQSVDDYIESFHSRSAFSRERMTSADAAAFDAELRQAIAQYLRDGEPVRTENKTSIIWGRPK
jgi:SAM-dependent methyltransferase